MKTTPNLTPAFCNKAYNNRLLVPNAAEIISKWSADSKSLRRRLAALYDLPYGEGRAERLDLFPAQKEGAPLFVFIHGGYWRSLDKSDFTFIAPALVAAGISVAIVNYSHAPKVTIEDIVMENVRALAWLFRNAAKYGYDRSRIQVGGHSAGGHLTAMMMCARWAFYSADLPADLVKGGVAISGVYDLEPIRRAQFLNIDLRLDAASVARLSPAYMKPKINAPLITSVGGAESSEFIRQNALIGKRWRKNFASDVAMPGRNHFTICDEFSNPESPLFKAVQGLCLGT